MSSVSNYSNTFTLPNGVLINYKEVPVPNTSYSKVVLEDGTVAILIHADHGAGWSSSCACPDNKKHQFVFDSRLVLFVLSDKFKTLFNRRNRITAEAVCAYQDLMTPIFPDLEDYYSIKDANIFSRLEVRFIPENTPFRITEYDGAEGIEIFDMNNYMFS
jgi:hypothetical protein